MEGKARKIMFDRTALVTGAAGFLGAAICDKLSKKYKVIGLDITESKFTNVNYMHHVCDITREEDMENIAERLSKEGIKLDVIINNAAINPKVEKEGLIQGTSSRIEEYDLNAMRREMEVSLIAPVLIAKCLMKLIREKDDSDCVTSCFVNISSDLGIIAPDNRLYRDENKKESEQKVKPIGYSIVKSGILGFSRYMATYSPQHFRSNSICPGGIFNNQGDEFLKKIEEKIPLKRMANVSEVVNAVEFLASTKSTYMNGAELVVDGGRSIW